MPLLITFLRRHYAATDMLRHYCAFAAAYFQDDDAAISLRFFDADSDISASIIVAAVGLISLLLIFDFLSRYFLRCFYDDASLLPPRRAVEFYFISIEIEYMIRHAYALMTRETLFTAAFADAAIFFASIDYICRSEMMPRHAAQHLRS